VQERRKRRVNSWRREIQMPFCSGKRRSHRVIPIEISARGRQRLECWAEHKVNIRDVFIVDENVESLGKA
jgi:hypothetical protein